MPTENELIHDANIKIYEISECLTGINSESFEDFKPWLMFQATWFLAENADKGQSKKQHFRVAMSHLAEAKAEATQYGIDGEIFEQLNTLLQNLVLMDIANKAFAENYAPSETRKSL